jgi:hypothetical protein
MIVQLQFGHVIDCKIIIRENIEPRELICRKAWRRTCMGLPAWHSIQGSTSPAS